MDKAPEKGRNMTSLKKCKQLTVVRHREIVKRVRQGQTTQALHSGKLFPAGKANFQ